ncbi:extracellular solute-binding protein [Caldicoprobacter algeriensis]|uniref:extracellular solute-binding protein n=1 Tax=Caldicoprobacter algeriensis TaxID=699281 RepID=UPI00207A827D|nr:extracellular solute-binding protein [Caldicoprobacter algeriensis]MCM8900816.1 extracellular solute-binding protein [Caldicoprobacter algeriensis]
MKKRYKLWLLILAASFLLSVLAGCSRNQDQKAVHEDSKEASIEGRDDSTVQQEEPPYEFDWMYQWIRELPPDNDPIKQIIEKDTNTKFNVIIPPPNEYAEKVQIAVASGDYPELIQFMGGMDWKTLAQQGAFIPIDDLLQYGPNLQKIIPEENWNLVKMDGKIWGVPLLNVRNPVQLFIRLDWIEELGLGDGWEDKLGEENFKTIDDFYNVLKAFKEHKNATYTCNGIGGLAPLFGAFGVMPGSDFYIKEGNEILRVTQHPRMKDALAWINKLYQEGLIDPEFITNKSEQLTNKALEGRAGMVYDIWNLPFRLDVQHKIQEIDPNAKWVRTNPPKGPEGYAYLKDDSRVMDGVFMISAKAKDPKRLIQFLDYLIDGKGYEVSQYGIEGIHFVRKDGKIEFTEEGKAEWVAVYGKMRHIWDPDFWYAKYSKYAENLEDAAMENPVLLNVAEAFTPGPIWKQYGADLNRYEQEMLLKFIIGEEPLDKWDEYVKAANEVYHAQEISEEIIEGLKADGRLN